MTLRTFTSNPNLSRTFDGLRGDQIGPSTLDVALHDTRALVLLKINGGAVMLGLEDQAALHLIDALLQCHARLMERAERDGNPRP